MTAVAEGRERATGSAKSRYRPPAPATTSDQASPHTASEVVAPGSGSNGQQAGRASVSVKATPAATNGQGRAVIASESKAEPPAPAYHELRVWAEMYADAQQTRIACTNRAERGGLDPMVLASLLAGLKDTEHQLRLGLGRCYRLVVPEPIRAWQKASPGIGEHLLARLLGTIGDPRWAQPYHWEAAPDGAESRSDPMSPAPRRVLVADEPFERNVAKLWAYCGHGDPTRRRRKGMTAEDGAALGNPRAKMLTHLLAEATMKCVGSDAGGVAESSEVPRPTDTTGGGPPTPGTKPTLLPAARRRSPYRDTYDQAKERYADRVDDDGKPWTPAHQHAAALRLVGKEILRDLWLAAGDRCPTETHPLGVPGGPYLGEPHPLPAAGEHHEEEASTPTT